MNDVVIRAINSVTNGKKAFCRFLTGNDTGATGAHQAGIYISKSVIPILFDTPGVRGENKDRWVHVEWQDGYETDTRFIYYGVGSRNEYRITNFGRGFPFLHTEYTGALFVFVQMDKEDYRGFFLNTDDDIQDFLDAFGISATETNRMIEMHSTLSADQEDQAIKDFISHLKVDFPEADVMSASARIIQDRIHPRMNDIRINPDQKIIDWTEMEFRLFRAVEQERYGEQISRGFTSVDDFITMANTVLNRRKSRAGKSLENHLAALFDANGIRYTPQAITEENKRPDFIFPSVDAYHDPYFGTDRLISLAAKTTCKDRWRQVLNEADRLRDGTKYLCTLQQGISVQQMNEMEAERVVLVVPQPYIAAYPKEKQDTIWNLHQFIDFVRETEEF